MDVIDFETAIKQSPTAGRSLLIGNGFSANYFSYRTLLGSADLDDDEPLSRLFKVLNTFDFESVIQSLESAASVEDAYSNNSQSDQFRADADKLRERLVHAIRSTHPTHREKVEKDFRSSRSFLGNFSKYFTLNYDLLLYWIQLDTSGYADGFGLGVESDGFRGPFKVGAYCNTYNLHGGLHLFLDAVGEVQKQLMGPTGVIDAIARTVTEQKRLPLYVAEGTWQAKLTKINSVSYLRYCLDQLSESRGDMFVFGHSASDNDTHIYNAIFDSKITHLYFGIYKPNVDSVREFDAKLAKFQKLSGKSIQYTFYDAESARVWG